MLWLQRGRQSWGISATFWSEFCLKNNKWLRWRSKWLHTCHFIITLVFMFFFFLPLALLDKWPADFSEGKSDIYFYLFNSRRVSFVVPLILTPSLSKCAQLSRLQEVSVDVDNSFLSWWKITHFDPQERLEHKGQPVSVSFDHTFPVVTAVKHSMDIFCIQNVFFTQKTPLSWGFLCN